LVRRKRARLCSLQNINKSRHLVPKNASLPQRNAPQSYGLPNHDEKWMPRKRCRLLVGEVAAKNNQKQHLNTDYYTVSAGRPSRGTLDLEVLLQRNTQLCSLQKPNKSRLLVFRKKMASCSATPFADLPQY
jgi:hypothetical protein